MRSPTWAKQGIEPRVSAFPQPPTSCGFLLGTMYMNYTRARSVRGKWRTLLRSSVYEGRGRLRLVYFRLACARDGAHPSKQRGKRGEDLHPSQAELAFTVICDPISATDRLE